MTPKIKKVTPIKPKFKEIKLKIVEPSDSEELEEKIEESEQQEFRDFLTSGESPTLETGQDSTATQTQVPESTTPPSPSRETESNSVYESNRNTSQENRQEYETAEVSPSIVLPERGAGFTQGRTSTLPEDRLRNAQNIPQERRLDADKYSPSQQKESRRRKLPWEV